MRHAAVNAAVAEIRAKIDQGEIKRLIPDFVFKIGCEIIDKNYNHQSLDRLDVIKDSQSVSTYMTLAAGGAAAVAGIAALVARQRDENGKKEKLSFIRKTFVTLGVIGTIALGIAALRGSGDNWGEKLKTGWSI